MSIPSNIYAEKLLGEHPLAMWSFDDTIDYISLISDSTRNISTWTTNSTATLASVTDSTAPFPSSYITEITGTVSPTAYVDAYSFLSSTNTFTSTSGTFTLSFYLKTNYRTAVSAGFGTGLSATIQSAVPDVSPPTIPTYITYTTTTNHGFENGDYVQITGVNPEAYDTSGFVADKTDTTFRIYFTPIQNAGNSTGGTALSAKTQSVFIDPAYYAENSWIPVSFTFSDSISNQKILLGFTYAQTNPKFYVNGLTIGKDSQPFNGESFGLSLSSIPATIATEASYANGVESKSFGTQEYSAYYIGNGESLYAKNSGMSMSYGSEKSARIYPNATANKPSFIFPAFGMLNNAGRYRKLSLETLIRITANNSIPKRIIGPISSTDGIYVTKDVISLKINDSIGSFHLNEMFRPMILQMSVGRNFAKLCIDGEEIINLPINNSALSLPNEFNNDSPAKSQDWFGIYAYSDIPLIEMESLAIFPYESSDVLGRLNLVYAQGVNTPLIANSVNNGKTILADFSFANYSNNYNYPSFHAKWEQTSIADNLDILQSIRISPTKYSAPNITTSLYSSDSLLLDLYETYLASGETNSFINLRPSSVVSGSNRVWSTNQGYIELSSFNKNTHLSNCVYGIFKSLETSGTEQILIKILNQSTNDYIKISLTGTTVSYSFKYQNDAEVSLDTAAITQNNLFAVGIDIQKLILSNSKIASFFANYSNITILVGGQSVSANTFTGNIYKVGLCSKLNFENISNLFNASGILTSISSHSTLLPRTASYTMNVLNIFGKSILDIGSNSYWQDYVPLSKLAKTVINENGEEELSLDFIQLNIDYDEPRLYSGSYFNTTNSLVKTYISFQTLDSGANKNLNYFSASTNSPNKNRVIDSSTFSSTSKYEFVNGMIVYPPSDVDISNLAMVIHIEANTPSQSIIPISLRYLQIAAQSFNKNVENPVGTRHSLDVYPYTYSGEYDYNSKNAYLTYKNSNPYLYLTRHSGFRVVGPSSPENRGVYCKVGNNSPDTKVISMQMCILADIESFTYQKIFELRTNTKVLSFYINANGSITTDQIGIAPVYYMNGKKVGSPVLKLGEWNTIGITFPSPFDVSNTQGKLLISSRLLVNNVSFYYANPTEIDQKTSSITWSQLADNKWAIPVDEPQTPTRNGSLITINTINNHNLVVGEPIVFSGVVPSGYMGSNLYVTAKPSDTSFTYQNASAPTSQITTGGTVLGTWQYFSIPNYYAIYSNNPKNIYKIFSGTYKNVIETYNDSKKLNFGNYQYIAYMDVKPSTIVLDVR